MEKGEGGGGRVIVCLGGRSEDQASSVKFDYGKVLFWQPPCMFRLVQAKLLTCTQHCCKILLKSNASVCPDHLKKALLVLWLTFCIVSRVAV